MKRRTLTAAGLVAAVGLVAEPAAAVTLTRAPLGAHVSDPVVEVEGRGWGHGIGMGQWGARSMADRGASYRRILRHYYRGTRLQRAHTGSIRASLDSGRRVTVLNDRGVAVRSARGRFATSPRRASRYRVRADGKALTLFKSSGGRWSRIGSARRFVVSAPRTLIRVAYPHEVRGYRGRLEVRYERPFSLRAILHLPLEHYLYGVVPREMPAYWPMSALQAQAVGARTYALRAKRLARARGKTYDICATAACQVFGGSARWADGRGQRLEHPRTIAAVQATSGRVLTHRRRPILAMYSSSTGGHTRRGPAPYLRVVRDPGDRASPFHTWRTKIDTAHARAHWPKIGRVLRVRVTRRDGVGAWGGRVRRVVIEGSRASVAVSGDDFRRAFELRSNWFRIVPEPLHLAPVFRSNFGYNTRGPTVRRLQLLLRAQGHFPRNVDATGWFGPITKASVRRYQRAHGIRATGYVGPLTRAALNRRR